MKLENQVVSLELAKKLKELGAKQLSLFYWKDYKEKNSGDCIVVYGKDNSWYDHYSAFTVGELGEMMPEWTDGEKWLAIKVTNEKWQVWDEEGGYYDKNGNTVFADTEADARAKMLIYLIENNQITL